MALEFFTPLKTYRFPILFCLCYSMYSTVFPYLVMTSKSIGTQFQLGESTTWWLMTGERIIFGLSVIGISYFGGRSEKKAKLIGIGFTLVAAGCFILALTAFITPLPVVEKTEPEMWKGIYEPATKEDISTPHKLLDSFWGKKFPEDLRQHLNETGNQLLESKMMEQKMSTKNFTKRSTSESEIETMYAGTISKLREELSFGMKSINSKTMELSKRMKRQMPGFEFPDEIRDRLKSGFESAVVSMIFFGDPYEDFAEHVYNLTNAPDIFEKIMMSARLPFGYCRNTSMLVRNRLAKQACVKSVSNMALVGLVLAFAACALIGFGGAMIATIAVPYLEDLMGFKAVPNILAVLGILHGIFAFVGMGLGMVCDLLMYSTFNTPESLIAIDPRWVGAWWLGLMIIAILMKIPATIMIVKDSEGTFFGNLMATMRGGLNHQFEPNAAMNNGNGHTVIDGVETKTADCVDKSASYTVNPPTSTKTKGVFFKSLFDTFMDIFKSPMFVCLLIATVLHTLALYGYFMFMPIYAMNNFLPDPNLKYAFIGSTMSFYLFFGIPMGAIFMYRFKFDGKKLATCMFVCVFMVMSITLCQIWLGCNSVVQQIQDMSLKNPTYRPIWNPCPGCICDSSDFYPVCANDSMRTPYYSPCHAGCTNFTYEIATFDVEFQFDYCACAETPRTLVSREFCRDDCFGVEMTSYTLFVMTALICGILVVPTIVMVMRSTMTENRCMALGIMAFCIYIFGVLPSSILYRFVTDSACFVSKSTCGHGRGYCEMYDTQMLRYRYHGFAALLNFVAYIFYGMVWYHAKTLMLAKETVETTPDAITTTETTNSKEETPEVMKEETELKNGNGEMHQNGGAAENGDQNTFIGKL